MTKSNFDIPEGTLCAKSCGREAAGWYGDHISAMDIAHGIYGEPLCEYCILTRQLEYAIDIVQNILPIIEKIRNLKLKENTK